MKPKLRWSDAWFLYSVINGGRGWVPLNAVLGTGDAVNHSVFTLTEIRGAVARLSAHGHLEAEGTNFRVTPSAKNLWRKTRSSRYALEQLEKLGKLIGADQSLDHGDPNVADPEWDYPGVTEEDLDRAFADYENKMKR